MEKLMKRFSDYFVFFILFFSYVEFLYHIARQLRRNDPQILN